MNTVSARITQLQNTLKAKCIDAYIIPMSDFHSSEYVGAHFMLLPYYSGFTGSAGTLVVTKSESALFTDGRYFLQAERELIGSPIALMKAGMPGVLSVEEYIYQIIPENGTFGADARVLPAKMLSGIEKMLAKKNASIKTDEDIAGDLMENRPQLPSDALFLLPDHATGQSRKEKIAVLRDDMDDADAYLISALDEVAWLFNMRGRDVENNPVVLAFAAITKTDAILFVDEAKCPSSAKAAFEADGVTIRPYASAYEFATQTQGMRVLVDPSQANYALYNAIAGERIERMSPVSLRKACKNEVERENMRACHIEDGVAVCEFMHKMLTHENVASLTELDVASMMEGLRASRKSFFDLCFGTIVGYGPHSAIIHYHANEETNAHLDNKSFLLVDGGAQYEYGTTDITRTLPLGELSDEERMHYTLVLKGMLALSNTRFPSGTSGGQLDAIARVSLWKEGIDYAHGTGHGVGAMLSVHEGPARIAHRIGGDVDTPLSAGMILSCEPGSYVAGKFGVRIENLVMVSDPVETAFGKFHTFETLTFAPIPKAPILKDVLGEDGISMLNAYHAAVREKLLEHISEDAKAWFIEATEAM